MLKRFLPRTPNTPDSRKIQLGPGCEISFALFHYHIQYNTKYFKFYCALGNYISPSQSAMDT